MFSFRIVQSQFRLPLPNHTVRKIGTVFVLFMQLLLLIPTCKSIRCFVSSTVQNSCTWRSWSCTNKKQISSYIRKLRMGWLKASLYMIKYLPFSHIWGSPSSYITLQLLYSVFTSNRKSVWIRQGSTLLNLSFHPSVQEPVPGPTPREGEPAAAHERQQRRRSNPAPWLRRQCLSDSLEKT